MVPNRVATERLGVLERRRYQTSWKHIWLGMSRGSWLDLIERPFDDDPAQFSKLIVQLGVELVAGLGSRVSPEELDDEVTDLGDHWNQANGQRQQGGGEVRCQEERGTRSIIHRASFPG